ncbi:right-handed parallel beta-helix repeat-containing protein [Halorubrum sp. CSM-61]|uniref:right-handed parallel beta-helix repeat-containing protein n=1 Tax=Halorubrum sp. CSM-61 TaxID=2485838 RepID=UPI0013DE7596|nr:right-handed parallel beta-helix repeat-containing protein [Halorubrum sp. CSM-61]
MTENGIELAVEDGKVVGKHTDTGETIPIELGETSAEPLTAGESGIGPDADIVIVSPDDDWHRAVGDENDPVEDALVYVLPGEHEVRRRTLVTSHCAFVGVGDATLSYPDVHQATLTSDVGTGDVTVEVDDASEFEVGRGIVLFGPDREEKAGRNTHHTHVTDISGNALELNEAVRGSAAEFDEGDVCAQTHSAIATRIDEVSSENIHVRNLTFDGGGRDADAPADFTVAFTYVFGDDGGSVRDCVMRDFHSEGISNQRGTSRELRNNTVRNVAYNALHVGVWSDGTEVIGNWIEDCDGTGIYISDDTNHMTIQSNDVIDCRGSPSPEVPSAYQSAVGGIGDFDTGSGEGGSGGNHENTVKHNHIDLTGASAGGIEARNTVDNRFVDNRIQIGTGYGIEADGVSDSAITGNKIMIEDGEPGDYCIRTASACENLTISGNTLLSDEGSSGCIRVDLSESLVADNALSAPGRYPMWIGRRARHVATSSGTTTSRKVPA